MIEHVLALLADDNLEEAVKFIPKTDMRLAIRGNLSRLNKRFQQGIIGEDFYAVERNKIADATMKQFGISSYQIPIPEETLPSSTQSTLFARIEELIKATRRRGKTLREEAQELRQSYLEYREKRNELAGFDKYGRRERALLNRLTALEAKLSEQRMDTREEQFAKIREAIEAPVPSWEDIKNAWTLAHGAGMRSSYIPEAIRLESPDDDAKITATEEIEAWMDS